MQLETDLGVDLFGLPRLSKPLRDTADLLKTALERFGRLFSFKKWMTKLQKKNNEQNHNYLSYSIGYCNAFEFKKIENLKNG